MLMRRLSALAILLVAFSGTAVSAAPAHRPQNEQTVAQRQQRPGNQGGGQGNRGNGSGMGRGQGGGMGGDRLLQQLNLSQEQMQQIENIRTQYQSQFQAQMEQMRTERERMQNLLASDASEGDLRNQHNKMTQLHQKMGEMRFNQMMEIRRVLTSEQRRQMAQLMQQRGPGGGRGNQGDMGGPSPEGDF
ncbi:Spy/CpxP family protein refolding chaperone [[Phormidium] sp. ETS-05]|uniref:Spy/CpxP family protein refolding chaperone n=1 Tax=[Phormidium] sp. ETS-05 TaxID=222819 RepID=UPI0018EED62C|nr:Spy/CpxP family protein refolding chaperone [[Phormidium] sp. ETS-05]